MRVTPEDTLRGRIGSHLRLRRAPRRVGVLAIGLAAIVAWQNWALRPNPDLDAPYEQHASVGTFDEARFVYFYDYLGLMPVMSTHPAPEMSRAGALRLLHDDPGSLRMDSGWTWFEGDYAKLLLYLPGAWAARSPREPSVKLANRIAFQVALCGAFFSFWWIGLPLLGALAVAFTGSDPFQLRSVYALEGVHGWVITAALLLLAINLPLLDHERPSRGPWRWIAPVLTGVLIGTVRGIRGETAALLGAGMLACLVPGASWRARAGLAATLVVAFTLTDLGWRRYFQGRYEEAQRVVRSVGGHVLTRPFQLHHRLWHPIFCGLSDFDRTHGYRWLDEAALDYAKPVIEARYRIYVPPTLDGNNGTHVDDRALPAAAFWDRDRIYRRLPYSMAEYQTVLRDKVLGDIARDPAWYAAILARRAGRIQARATPVRLAVGPRRWTLPWSGWLLLPVAALLAVARSWTLLKIVVFTLPTSFTAFLIYSARGTTYYGTAHLFAAVVTIALIAAAARRGIVAALARGAPGPAPGGGGGGTEG